MFIVYTYVKGCTGEHAVANTVVVYAYNMWYPCTGYVHVSASGTSIGGAFYVTLIGLKVCGVKRRGVLCKASLSSA